MVKVNYSRFLPSECDTYINFAHGLEVALNMVVRSLGIRVPSLVLGAIAIIQLLLLNEPDFA